MTEASAFVRGLIQERDALQRRIDAVLAIDPADHATTSRDYGRGFADAITRVRAAAGSPT